ncbi:hypothetical protein I4U23_023180 [Adineta vaga]|nr:hypothetical protein I4U23_023180 [Adineta vaga]
MENYTEALIYLQEALNYQEESNPFHPISLANTYEYMAKIYKVTKEYPKVLETHENLSQNYEHEQ